MNHPVHDVLVVPRARMRIRARWFAPLAGLLLGACITTYEDAPLFGNVELQRPEFAVVQTISLGDATVSEAQRPAGRAFPVTRNRLECQADFGRIRRPPQRRWRFNRH